MELLGVIENLQYRKVIETPLKEFIFPNFSDIDINSLPPACVVRHKDVSFALCWWRSPKRSRSYPYARVYDTLFKGTTKSVAVIPLVKDEGIGGDRDYLQWDTVSLMSLLNVYVIPAYYCKARRKSNRKIEDQKFDTDHVRRKLEELRNYQASALHWNIKELSKENLSNLIDRVLECYKKIAIQTGVELHSETGLLKFKAKIEEGIQEFISFSRDKAKDAQRRERTTIQPKEQIILGMKASITIKNYLGGLYFLTVDGVEWDKDIIYLIESKHSSKSIVPKEGDIKDGLIKMILLTNISRLYLNGKQVKFKPVLKLTSDRLSKNQANVNSLLPKLRKRARNFFEKLIEEARLNNFDIRLEGSL